MTHLHGISFLIHASYLSFLSCFGVYAIRGLQKRPTTFTPAFFRSDQDNKVHGANMGPTGVQSAPDGPHVGPMNLAIRGGLRLGYLLTLAYDSCGVVYDQGTHKLAYIWPPCCTDTRFYPFIIKWFAFIVPSACISHSASYNTRCSGEPSFVLTYVVLVTL